MRLYGRGETRREMDHTKSEKERGRMQGYFLPLDSLG